MSGFSPVAEYHEFFMTEPWLRLSRRLAELPAPRHVAELGAGSGLGTVRLAHLWPGARFTVVEPDDTMRAMLMARLQTAGLAHRVEVLPLAVSPETADFLRRRLADADLLLAAHMLRLLPDDARRVIYDLARALPPGGRFVATLGKPHGHELRSASLGGQLIIENPDGAVRYRHLDVGGHVLREADRRGLPDGPEHPNDDAFLAEALAAGLDAGVVDGLLLSPPTERPRVDPRQLTDAHNRWLTKLDPLCGPVTPPEGDEWLATPSTSGLAGTWRTTETPADAPYALWLPPTEECLTFRSAQPPTADDFGHLLRAWQAVRVPQSATLTVDIPAAALHLTRPLLEAGFCQTTSLAARLVVDEPAPSSAVEVRPMSAADRPALLDLLLELHHTDSAVGSANPLPDAHRHYAHYLDEAFARPGWSWVAWANGHPAGLLTLNPLRDSAWIAPCVSLERVCYLGFATVGSAHRARGFGRALVEHAMHRAALAGAEAVLLHHAAASPLSSTFWHRQGFRPLWSTWRKQA